MKSKLIWIAGLGLMLIAVLLLPRKQHPTIESASSEQLNTGIAQRALESASTGPVSPAPESSRSLSDRQDAPEQTVTRAYTPPVPRPQKIRIRADQALATVNGVVITLKDLMPLKSEASGDERSLDPERYSQLLNRAIERELAFQSAKPAAVGLTAAQEQNLAKRAALNSQTDPAEFDNLGRSDANTEFEQRDSAGLMLLHNLAAAAGVPSPHVTTDLVRAYYAQYYPTAAAGSGNSVVGTVIDNATDATIRAQLAPLLKAQHDEQFRQFVEQLKASAQITVPGPI